MGRLPEHVQLMALALLNYADDEGYFLADPALVRSFARPFDEDSRKTTGALQELSRIEYVTFHQSAVHGSIGHIVNFEKHQYTSHPKASKIKQYASVNLPVTLPKESCPEQGTGNREQGKEQGGAQPQMHPLQYAERLLEILGMPQSFQNKTIIAQAIEAEAKYTGRQLASVAEFLAAKARDDRDEGISIDKFYFEDCKWRNGNGKAKPVSASAARSDRSKRNILDGLTRSLSS